jgi:hypothetical protein
MAALTPTRGARAAAGFVTVDGSLKDINAPATNDPVKLTVSTPLDTAAVPLTPDAGAVNVTVVADNAGALPERVMMSFEAVDTADTGVSDTVIVTEDLLLSTQLSVTEG